LAAAAAGHPLDPARVDYGAVIAFKLPLLRRSFERLKAGADQELAAAFERFKAENSAWLDDYALFMALKEAHGGVSWNEWPAELRSRDASALERARAEHAAGIEMQQYLQFLFFSQWAPLKAYANQK